MSLLAQTFRGTFPHWPRIALNNLRTNGNGEMYFHQSLDIFLWLSPGLIEADDPSVLLNGTKSAGAKIARHRTRCRATAATVKSLMRNSGIETIDFTAEESPASGKCAK